MITLTAKIDLLRGNSATLSLPSSYLPSNNISADFSAILGVRKQANSPFIIGSSKIGDGSTFSNSVDYFIGDELSDENGEFPTAYDFVIESSKSIKSLTFAFDTTNNRHPVTFMVDGKDYSDDDPIVTAIADIDTATHHIHIENWNTPNSPLVVTGIYAEVIIEIDRRNLISLERTIYDRVDMKLPSFGIISNTGNIEFKDIDGEVRDYAEMGLLEKGLECTISLNNTLAKNATQVVGVMETDEWNYDDENKTVSVSLKDDLEEWQEINVDAINYDPRDTEPKAFLWLYSHLWTITNKNYKMLAANPLVAVYGELDEETKAVLNNTYIKYPMLESCTLWQAWQKLCEVCHLHIYKGSNGVIVCKYNGGN